MKCELCSHNLLVASNQMKSEKDSTDVYSEQTLVCVNKECNLYSGKDIGNPENIANTIRTKVN